MNKKPTEYTPLSKAKAALYSRLGSVKTRRKEGLFLVAGEKCVADTREAFSPEALIASREWLEANASSWPEDIVRVASEGELSKLSGMSSAPAVVAVYRIPESDVDDLKIPDGQLALLLDGVQDPGNFGSILRTADWFGVTRVFASHDTVDLYNPKVIQATMGAVSRVKVTYCDLAEVIGSNPELPVYGTLLEGKDIYQTRLEQHAMIVMGNEGKGVSPEIRKLISHALLIPPYDPQSHGESLNVGAATAVTLAAFRFKH